MINSAALYEEIKEAKLSRGALSARAMMLCAALENGCAGEMADLESEKFFGLKFGHNDWLVVCKPEYRINGEVYHVGELDFSGKGIEEVA